MIKQKKEKNLETTLYAKLNKLTPEEVEPYLESLLRKCLEAVIQEDYLTLGSVEDLLNKSIGILAYKISNFNLLYSNAKLNVVTECLAKYVNVKEIQALDFIKVVPDFINAETVENTLAYKRYERHFNYFNEDSVILENEAYICILEEDSENLNIIDKTSKNGINEHSINTVGFFECSYNWSDEFEVLEGFITNSIVKEPSEHIKYVKIKKTLEKVDLYERYFEAIELSPENICSFFSTPFETDIYYCKENDKFIAVIDKYHLHIYYKETGTSIKIYLRSNTEFLYKFCDYCLGLEPKKLDVPEEDLPVNADGTSEDQAENISNN